MYPKGVAAENWHPALSELEFTSIAEAAPRKFDVAVATWWLTVYQLPHLRFRHPVYFVQSMETRHEVDYNRSVTALAELTYSFGIPAITIATWMQAYLAFQHDAPSFIARNGIDKSRYSTEGPVISPRPKRGLRVLIEGPVNRDAPRKGIDESIEVAKRAGCDGIWLLTSSDVEDYPDCDVVFSRVPADKTGEIYRSCNVLLKQTNAEGMFGPPLEMFHCGGTVVTNDVAGHEEYIVHGVNGLVAGTDDPDAAVAALRRLKDDRVLLDRLVEGAITTAEEWHDWERSSREFGRILATIARQPARDLAPLCRELLGASELDRIVQSRY
jgi:glycosyltransferase involved in cell wall biosynthesis